MDSKDIIRQEMVAVGLTCDFDGYVDTMEAFIALDRLRENRILRVLRRAMLADAYRGEECCKLEYEEPSPEEEAAMFVFEEWLQAHDYDFVFEQERREGVRYITLTIHLWL